MNGKTLYLWVKKSTEVISANVPFQMHLDYQLCPNSSWANGSAFRIHLWNRSHSCSWGSVSQPENKNISLAARSCDSWGLFSSGGILQISWVFKTLKFLPCFLFKSWRTVFLLKLYTPEKQPCCVPGTLLLLILRLDTYVCSTGHVHDFLPDRAGEGSTLNPRLRCTSLAVMQCNWQFFIPIISVSTCSRYEQSSSVFKEELKEATDVSFAKTADGGRSQP